MHHPPTAPDVLSSEFKDAKAGSHWTWLGTDYILDGIAIWNRIEEGDEVVDVLADFSGVSSAGTIRVAWQHDDCFGVSARAMTAISAPEVEARAWARGDLATFSKLYPDHHFLRVDRNPVTLASRTDGAQVLGPTACMRVEVVALDAEVEEGARAAHETLNRAPRWTKWLLRKLHGDLVAATEELERVTNEPAGYVAFETVLDANETPMALFAAEPHHFTVPL